MSNAECLTLRLIAVVVAVGSFAPRAEAVISGRVSDVTGQGLPSVRIRVQSLSSPQGLISSTTEKSGHYVIEGVPTGFYFVEASLPGFLTVRYYPVFIDSSKSEELNFALPFDWHTITIDKIDVSGALVFGVLQMNTSVLKNAMVCLVRDTATDICSRTNDFGYYSMIAVSGKYALTVSCRGGQIYRDDIDLLINGEYPGLVPRLDERIFEDKSRDGGDGTIVDCTGGMTPVARP